MAATSEDAAFLESAALDRAAAPAISDRLVAEGTPMPSASVRHGRSVIRLSVSSWRTVELEVRDPVAAVAGAAHVPARSTTAVGE